MPNPFASDAVLPSADGEDMYFKAAPDALFTLSNVSLTLSTVLVMEPMRRRTALSSMKAATSKTTRTRIPTNR